MRVPAVAARESFGLAVLSLDYIPGSGLDEVLAERGEDLAPDAEWAAVVPFERGLERVSGTVLDLVRTSSGPMLELKVSAQPPSEIPLGTPIFARGLAGIVVQTPAEGGRLLAAPLSAILEVLHLDDRLDHPSAPPPPEGASIETVAPDAPAKRKASPRKKATKKGTAARPASDGAELFKRLSRSSTRALAHAEGMSGAMGQSAIHMEHLLLALYEKDGGPTRRELERAGIDEGTLRKRLSDIAEAALPAYGGYEVRELTGIPPHSAHVEDALQAAILVADAHESEQVQSRHLLFGALSQPDCGAVRWLLVEHHVDPERIDMSAPPSKAVDATPRPKGRAQVKPDLAEGKDLLKMEGEVEALCAIIAAKDTSPPMSIGLFGDWGTGKSFFMSLMDAEIRALKKVAREQPGSAFCENIVQLHFNAWHYIDTDLWASLTAEIFDGLAAALRKEAALTGGKDAEAERARLLAATTHLRDARSETERRKTEADAALRAGQERLDSLARNERELVVRLSSRELAKAAYRFVAGQPEIAKELERGAEKLGIPRSKALASDTRTQLLELKGMWGDVKAIYIALRTGSSKYWLFLLLIVLAAMAFGTVQFGRYTEALSRFAVAAATLLVSGLAFLGTALPLARGGLKTIRDARDASEGAIRDEQERRRKSLEDARAAVQQRVFSEEEAIDRINAELSELEHQLALLRADREMADFIWAKQASTDYTRHFGVIARARSDFERLSTLLGRVVEEDGDGDTLVLQRDPNQPQVPRIDRIVLYIDDLDRCPESKVVDVLQAVHLLLAFPLFIVVVGVDSRWLLHSLRQHASVFRAGEKGSEMVDEEEQIHCESTPFNYLEKIFQIPFNLRPMEEDGFARLIDDLTGAKGDAPAERKNGKGPQPTALDTAPERSTKREENRGLTVGTSGMAAPPSVSTTPGTFAGDKTSPGRHATPAPEPPQRQTTQAELGKQEHRSRVIDPNPPFLDLSPGEREFMKAMHRLIPTPRAAKRYVNVYRLFRASLADERRAALEDPEEATRARKVLLLLAIVTGYPQEGAVILRELVQRDPKGGWWAFLEDLVTEYSTPRAAKATTVVNGAHREPGPEPERTPEERHRAQRWNELYQRLSDLREEISEEGEEDPLCPAFSDWAKYVARYSFESGRVLTARHDSAYPINASGMAAAAPPPPP